MTSPNTPVSPRVTIRDVAARAGVSQPTASLVLGQHPKARVAAATRERVLAAAEALGYRPNVVARSLVSGRSFALGLVVPDLRNPFVMDVVAGAERVFAILDEQPRLEDAPDAKPLARIGGDVLFEDVSFSYEAGVPVLAHISFHAKPGQIIALVGPTGAGKTTIVNLLTRFYDIDSGQINLDGHDIRTLKLDDLRRQVGLVLQDTFLFAGTVMENIRYGRLDATDEEVRTAATLANADPFVQRLPQGYDTPLSERANNLSQGQRQLLAIARAILADPSILILDEATSSVDTRTEQHIQEAMLRLMSGRTSFVIAHRLSTIRNADQILVINHGEAIERGTHKELLAQRGFYYQLYTSQFRANGRNKGHTNGVLTPAVAVE